MNKKAEKTGKIYYLIGKSSTGKDTIFGALLKDETLALTKIVQYSTRPKRGGEQEGVEYHFITEAQYEALERAGKVIECRSYNTVHGIWRYMMVDDGSIDLGRGNYLAVGTIESYRKVADYFGDDRVVPIQIIVETGERLYRAVMRERSVSNPKYLELCRRFLADEADFSDEKLREAGLMDETGALKNAVQNNELGECIDEIASFIRNAGSGKRRENSGAGKTK